MLVTEALKVRGQCVSTDVSDHRLEAHRLKQPRWWPEWGPWLGQRSLVRRQAPGGLRQVSRSLAATSLSFNPNTDTLSTSASRTLQGCISFRSGEISFNFTCRLLFSGTCTCSQMPTWATGCGTHRNALAGLMRFVLNARLRRTARSMVQPEM